MARSPGESSVTGDANLLPASVPDIGRSLRSAREQSGLTLTQAAERFGLRMSALEALENGGVEPQHDRIETLRTLRTYATALGLPGDHYVLVAVEQWPDGAATPPTNGDTAVVPVVSISSAPAGGHSAAGAVWARDATGVADATTTGVFEPVTRPVFLNDSGAMNDTSQVPVVNTGEVRAVSLGTPRFLRVLVGVVAFLIVVGGVGLVEHDHVNHWFHDIGPNTANWYDNAKSAVGITSTPKGHPTATTTTPTAGSSKSNGKNPTVKVIPDFSGQSATFNVSAPSFLVRILADKAPCWVQVTVAGNPRPIFSQVLPAGQSHVLAVTSSTTVETGSGSGRAYMYAGLKLIGSYTPAKTPFTMTFNPQK
jgi:Helix-turn-helix domain